MDNNLIGVLVEYNGERYVIDFVNHISKDCGLWKISPFNIYNVIEKRVLNFVYNDRGEIEPVNNYFRNCCYWCNIVTKSVKGRGKYCPKCLR